MIEWISFHSNDLHVKDDNAPFDFEVSRFPITVAQFAKFVDSDGYTNEQFWSAQGWQYCIQSGIMRPTYWGKPGYDVADFPVTGISFWEAEAFAAFCDARLPFESEWRLIATNGGETRCPWGDEYTSTFPGNSGFFENGFSLPLTVVSAYSEGRSRHGIWDLLGNVAEWCILDSSQVDQSTAVLCGGSRWNPCDVIDSWFRDEVACQTRDNQTGIRLVKGPRLRSNLDLKRGNLHVHQSPVRRCIKRPTLAFRQEGYPDWNRFESWALRVTGDVEIEQRLSLQELKDNFPQTEVTGLFVCVCRWADYNTATGVLLNDLLRVARPKIHRDRLHVLQRSYPGASGKRYESCLSAVVHDFTKILLCHSLDGEPLTKELGWPLRTICFDVYGYKQVKCLEELRIQADFQNGWWEEACSYDPIGKLRSGMACLIGQSPRRIEIKQS